MTIRYAASAGAASAWVGAATAAFAHPGPHDSMGFTELAAHVATGWHLVLLLVAALALTAWGCAVARRGHRHRGAGAIRDRRSRP